MPTTLTVGRSSGPATFPLTYDAFITRFPEFADTDMSLVNATLNDAALEIDVRVWGPIAATGQGYLTAHRLALSPFGQAARLIATDGKTTYDTFFQKLVRKVSSGFRLT